LSQLSKEQINFIASEVASLLRSDRPLEQKPNSMKIPVPEVHTSGTGIFNDLDSAVQAAKAAQQHLISCRRSGYTRT
jgi:hypothetical protein